MAAANKPTPRKAARAPAQEATAAAADAPKGHDGEAVAAPAVVPAPRPAPAAEPAAAIARPAPAAEKRCYVVGSVPIRHDGKFYGIGYDIELTSAEANRLGRLVALLPEIPKE